MWFLFILVYLFLCNKIIDWLSVKISQVCNMPTIFITRISSQTTNLGLKKVTMGKADLDKFVNTGSYHGNVNETNHLQEFKLFNCYVVLKTHFFSDVFHSKLEMFNVVQGGIHISYLRILIDHSTEVCQVYTFSFTVHAVVPQNDLINNIREDREE